LEEKVEEELSTSLCLFPLFIASMHQPECDRICLYSDGHGLGKTV